MPKKALIAMLLLAPAISGCAVTDAIFALFGDSYSAAGPSLAEKRQHYDDSIEAAEAYAEARRHERMADTSAWHATALPMDE